MIESFISVSRRSACKYGFGVRVRLRTRCFSMRERVATGILSVSVVSEIVLYARLCVQVYMCSVRACACTGVVRR